MPCSEVNKRAKANGDFGEKAAQKLLLNRFRSVKYTNQLIDYYAENKIPIEVKTCQEYIKRGYDRKGRVKERAGRFTFDKDQHLELIHKNGYYLFLVKNESMIVRGQLVRARDIAYLKQIAWPMVIVSGAGNP